MTTFKPLVTSQIDIISQMMKDFYAIDNYAIDIEVSKKNFQEFIANENLGKAFLIFNDYDIVGYVILTYIFSFEYKGRITFLDELYIIESARGKGIGRQTIQFIKQEASKLNLKLIYLEVENHNQIAQNLYLDNGFEVHNRKLMKFKF